MASELAAGHAAAILVQWYGTTGMSQRQFARLVGRHESEWSLIRRGRRRPTTGFVRAALARAPEPWHSALERAYLRDLAETAA